MRATLLSLLLLLVCFPAFNQKLTLKEILILCNKPNWTDINDYLAKSGWEFHESKKGDDEHYSSIVLAYEKSRYDDKAFGWFTIYSYSGLPCKITYEFYNVNSYNTIKNDISTAKMVRVNERIDNDEITIEYKNSTHFLSITTKKRETEDKYTNESSRTVYHVTVTRRLTIYDPDNGPKTYFDEETRVTHKYTLKDGELDGLLKKYYENGKLKAEVTFIKGKKHGVSKEYDEEGRIVSAYTYNHGVLSGSFSEFDNGDLTRQGTYVNGKQSGLTKEYNEGKISAQYLYKDDLLHGQFTEFFYSSEGKLNLKAIGNYVNGNLDGQLTFIRLDEKLNEKVIAYTTYLNGEKNGPFKEVAQDSIICGHYINGKLNGAYSLYLDNEYFLTGVNYGDTSKAVLDETGFFKEDKKVGHWKLYLSGDLVAEGNYDQEKVGPWNYYLPTITGRFSAYSHKLYASQNFKNGSLNGPSYDYLEEERVRIPCAEDVDEADTCYQTRYHSVYNVAHFKEGVLDGNFESRDSTGLTILKGKYLEGTKEGLWIETEILTDSTGVDYYMFEKGSYEGGYKQGSWARYRNENKLLYSIRYNLGKLHGETRAYNSAGKVDVVYLFEDHELKRKDIYSQHCSCVTISYEILHRTPTVLKVRRRESTSNGSVSQVIKVEVPNTKVIKGNVLEQFVSYGVNDGEYLRYNSDGKTVQQGNFKGDTKVGMWITYYYDRNIMTRQLFEGETKHAIRFIEISSGQPFNGKLTNFIDDENNLQFDCKIVNGMREGKCKYYNENGNVFKTEKFINGVVKL